MIKKNPEFAVDKANILLDFLLSKLKTLTLSNIKTLLVHGDVLVDNQITKDFNYRLDSGQKVIVKLLKIYDKDYKLTLDILYEDNDLIVINKQENLLTISTSKEKDKTAYHIVSNYVKRNNNNQRIFVVHRLDRDTSGILVFAKNQRIQKLLQDNWNSIVSLRGYIAIVEGKPIKEKDTIRSWLKETQTQIVYSSKKKGDGKEAITHYQMIKTNNKYSLLEVIIDTGRKNQIRVHMKDINHSIVGDKKYGAKTNPLKRLGLHAHALSFRHPITKEILHFETDVPDEFLSLI